MKRRSAQRSLAVFLFALIGAARAATPAAPATAPHVRLFADGIDVPMGTFYELVAVSKECVRRFPKECGDPMRKAMNGANELDPVLLDLGSLHAAARARATSPAFASMAEAGQKQKDLFARLESETRAYDFDVYARATGVYSGCSGDDDEHLHALASLYRADVLHFQGRSAGDLDREIKILDAERYRIARLIKDQWTESMCKKALALTRKLERAMYLRVKPVYADDAKPLSRQDRQGLVLGHVWLMASELAREHEPAVARRLDEYERGPVSPAK